jgi:hypothetical protein
MGALTVKTAGLRGEGSSGIGAVLCGFAARESCNLLQTAFGAFADCSLQSVYLPTLKPFAAKDGVDGAFAGPTTMEPSGKAVPWEFPHLDQNRQLNPKKGKLCRH